MDFRLAYQPIVDLAPTSTRRAVEALLRVCGDGTSYLDPQAVLSSIPSKQERRFLTWRILRRALNEFRDAQHTYGDSATAIAVNVSVSDLEEAFFASRFIELVKTSAVNPECVDLEISECEQLNEPALATMFELRAAGVGISMDDFGVACAALDWLAVLPATSVKIDKRFIQNAIPNRRYRTIVQRIVPLVRALDLPVIAEGIETEEQLALAENVGCTHAQGYLLGSPAFSSVRYAS